jgi:hypothetical protein
MDGRSVEGIDIMHLYIVTAGYVSNAQSGRREGSEVDAVSGSEWGPRHYASWVEGEMDNEDD